MFIYVYKELLHGLPSRGRRLLARHRRHLDPKLLLLSYNPIIIELY